MGMSPSLSSNACARAPNGTYSWNQCLGGFRIPLWCTYGNVHVFDRIMWHAFIAHAGRQNQPLMLPILPDGRPTTRVHTSTGLHAFEVGEG